MNNSDSQDTAPIEPSADELRLLQQLRANPEMAEKFGLIMKRFEQEIANGADANEAEMMVIDELRILGETMLKRWAQRSHQDAIDQAKTQTPNLSQHSQKNSSGILHSEPSP